MPETSKSNNTNSDANDITDSSAEFEFEAAAVPEPVISNYTRRIQLLMVGILFAIGVYSGAWYWFGNQLVKATGTAISDAALKGQVIDCLNPEAKGYPFRMGLLCAKTGFADPSQGIKIEAGAFRSAAQVYEPKRIIAELDSPLLVSAPQYAPLTVNWSLAHASIIGDGSLPERLSVEIETIGFAAQDAPTTKLGNAAKAAFHMRKGDNNQIDLAFNLEGATLPNAPAFNISSNAAVSGTTRFEAALKNSSPVIDVLRGNQGQLRDVTLAFADGGSVTISGPFSFSEAGLCTATFTVKAEKASALADNLTKLAKALNLVAPNLSVITAMGGTDGKLSLTITIKDGNASIGFIPIGQIPSL